MNSSHFHKTQPPPQPLLFPQPFTLPSTYDPQLSSSFPEPISLIKSRLLTRITKKFNSTPSLFSKLQTNQILNPFSTLSFRYKERLIQIDQNEFLKQLYSKYDIPPKLKLIITILSFLIKSYPNYLPLIRIYPVMQRNMKCKQHLLNNNYVHLINEYKRRYSKFDMFFDQSFYSSDSDSHSVIHYDPIFYPKKVNKSESIGSVENLVRYIHNIEEGYDDIGNGCLLTPTLKPKKSSKRRIGTVFSFIKNMVNFEGVGFNDEGVSMQEKFEMFLIGKKGTAVRGKGKINNGNVECNGKMVIKEDEKDGSLIIEEKEKDKRIDTETKGNVRRIYGIRLQEKLSKKYLDKLKLKEEEHIKKQKYKKTKAFIETKRLKKMKQYETSKEISKELEKHKPSLNYLRNKYNTPTKPLNTIKIHFKGKDLYNKKVNIQYKGITIMEKLPKITINHKKIKSMEHKQISPMNISTTITVNTGIQVNENKFLYKIPKSYMYSSSTVTTLGSPVSTINKSRQRRHNMNMQSLDSFGTILQRNSITNTRGFKTVSDVDFSSSNYYVLTTSSNKKHKRYIKQGN